MINLKDYKLFKENFSTLKEISKDDSDKSDIKYMTESTKEAVDFDTVKTKYVNDLGVSEEHASSVDGIFYGVNGIAFVEFKNGKMKNEKRKVKDKIRDSLLIFCDITESYICNVRNDAELIVVYNIDKNPLPNQLSKQCVQESSSRLDIAKRLSQKAQTEFVRFDLEKFKKLYFKDVHTYSEKEFEEYLNACI